MDISKSSEQRIKEAAALILNENQLKVAVASKIKNPAFIKEMLEQGTDPSRLLVAAGILTKEEFQFGLDNDLFGTSIEIPPLPDGDIYV